MLKRIFIVGLVLVAGCGSSEPQVSKEQKLVNSACKDLNKASKSYDEAVKWCRKLATKE